MVYDDLTKLYNRRELFDRLKQEIARSRRSQVPFSILMIDIDHFKDVNDTYGHIRGDRVLTEVANVIKESCREMDIPCRYGGDEFIVITPQTDRWAVEKVGQRILNQIRSYSHKGDEEQPDLQVTVSIGTATYQKNISTPELLIQNADQALYYAKTHGRNQICKDIDVVEKTKESPLNFKCFINRKPELTFLKSKFDSALNKQGNFVVISGEAGIGKTRLVNEIHKYCNLHKAYFLNANPFEFGVTPPYHIFFQLIRQYIEKAGHQHIQTLNNLPLVYRTELVKFIPEMRNMISTKQTPSSISADYEKLRMFEAVSRVIELIAMDSPLLIFLDDAQWSRKADFELLGYLVRNIAKLPVCVCCAYRIEEVHNSHPLNNFLHAMSREHRYETKQLNGLELHDTSRMLSTILGFFVPDKTCELIYNETNGNPFYIEEIIKTFVEDGTIYRDNSKWKIKNIDTVKLPSSVGDLIRRRFDDVDPDVKDLLETASVIGNQFSLALLQKITSKNQGHLFDLLDEAITHLLISEATDDNYTFTNVLLQRTLYDDISKTKRRRLHRSIAEALESIYHDTLEDAYEIIAHHYSQAETWQESLEYNLNAAETLRSVYANQDAIYRYSLCLDMIKKNQVNDPQKEIAIHQGIAELSYRIGNYEKAIMHYRILINRDDLDNKKKSEMTLKFGKVCQRVGDFDNAIACFEDGKKLLNEQKDQYEIAKLNTALIGVLIKRGEWDQAQKLGQQALEVFEEKQCIENIGSVYNALGTMYYERGEWDQAEEYYKKALDYRGKTQDEYSISISLNNLGNVYHRRSEFHRALDYHKHALKIREKIGDRFGIASSYNNMAVVFDDLGNFEECINYHNKSLEISKSIMNPHSVALSFGNLGYVYLKVNDYAKSLEYSKQALEIANRIGNISHVTSVKNNIAHAYIELERTEEALQLLYEAEQSAIKYEYKNLLTENHRLIAAAYLTLKEFKKSKKYLADALDIARKIKDKEAEGEGYVLKGRIYLEQKQLDKAIREFEKGIQISEGIYNTYITARCHYYIALIKRAEGDQNSSQEHLQEARKTFAQLGSKKFIELTKE